MILVVGATGQIGGELVRLLTAANAAVRALTRDPEKAAHLPAGVERVRGDLGAPETLAVAFAGVDKAFVMAHATPHMQGHVKNAVAAAKGAGARHIVFLSSYSVEHLPSSALGRWHRAGEDEVAASGIDFTFLRPGNFASNALRWGETIRAQGAVFDASAGSRSAPIDPRDIAAVAAAALTSDGHAGKSYTLTGPEVMTAREQVDVVARVLGKPVRHVPVPIEGARAGMLKGGMPEVIADAVLELVKGGDSLAEPLLTTAVRDVAGREAHTFETWARDNVRHLA